MPQLFKKLSEPNEDTVRLRREFLQFHAEFKIPPRNIPEIKHSNSSELLSGIFKHTNGIVFGEEHFDNVAAGFITDHMEYLHSLGVRKFFFEGLFYGMEKGVDGLRDEKDSTHNEYSRLISAAKNLGIEIIGIDSRGCKRGDGATRDIFMNAYAQKIINHHAENEKWIALVGMMHINSCTFIDSETFIRHKIHGISEMTGAIGMVIDPINDATESYIKYQSQFKAAPAKYINADIVYATPHHKISSEKYNKSNIKNPIEKLNITLNSLDYKLTYYDIDNHARFDTQTKQYIKGIIFAFKNENVSAQELESLKFKIKKDCGNSFNILLDSENSEIIFFCDAKNITLAAEEIKKSMIEIFDNV